MEFEEKFRRRHDLLQARRCPRIRVLSAIVNSESEQRYVACQLEGDWSVKRTL